MSTFTGIGTDGVLAPRGFAAHFRRQGCDVEGCVPFTHPGVCVIRNTDGFERRVVVKPGQYVELAGNEDVHHWEWPESIPDQRRSGSVLQEWVMELPLREQGTLLTAVRGCDVVPKYPLDSLPRRTVAAIRWSFMNPADPRETDIPGAFFSSDIPDPKQLSGIGHLPQHWFSHVWHAVEVLGYRHPDDQIRSRWYAFYVAMCHDQHTKPELMVDMIARLSEDRIAKNNVVS